MAERTGIENVFAAVAAISAVVAVSDLINRQKSVCDALTRHKETVALLKKLNNGINQLNAKIGK